MSDEINNTVKPTVDAANERLGAIIPSGTVLSGTTITTNHGSLSGHLRHLPVLSAVVLHRLP